MSEKVLLVGPGDLSRYVSRLASQNDYFRNIIGEDTSIIRTDYLPDHVEAILVKKEEYERAMSNKKLCNRIDRTTVTLEKIFYKQYKRNQHKEKSIILKE